MKLKNDKNRTPEIRQGGDISHAEIKSRLLGITSRISHEYGNDSIGLSGEDSQSGDTFSTRGTPGDEIPGKILSQLIGETEKQLIYHREQANELEARLEELRQLAGLHQDPE